MKLLKLYSNRKNFKTVEFNEEGLSVIVGADTDKSNDLTTLNGTGKTLILILIDFCLGSNSMNFLNSLKCDIYLDFKIKEEFFTVSRSTINQDKFILNEEPIEGVKEYRSKLNDLLSFTPENRITLRSLLPYFLRYRKSAYITPVDPGDSSKEDSWNHILTYVLGFDTKYPNKKAKLKKELAELNKFKKTIENKQIKNILSKNKDINLEIGKLNKELKELQTKQENFQVASNLNDLKEELNRNRNKVREITRKLIVNDNQIKKINSSINEEIKLKNEDIISIYNESKVILNDKVVKSLNEVQDFQKQLIINRKQRLVKDLEIYQEASKKLKENKNKIENQIDTIYKLLNSHGSFQELVILNNAIVEMNRKITSLSKFKELSDENKLRISEIKSQLASADLEAQQYLNAQKDTIEEINKYFSKIIEYLYGESGAGVINITNNDRRSTISRFKIDTKVYRDGSDGIGNMKIFAFGLLLLHIGKNPFDFLIFDNKIFYGVDAKQSASIIKYISNNNISSQIIVSINQSDYDAVIKKLEASNETNKLQDKVKLTLTGEESGTLLGQYIDLKVNKI